MKLTNRPPVVVGISRNNIVYGHVPPESDPLVMAARRAGHIARVIDMASMRVSPTGAVSDASGSVEVDVLAPFLLYGQPAAAYALSELTATVPALNPVAAVQVADDKWAGSRVLAGAGVAHIPTWAASDLSGAAQVAAQIGYPVVVKLPHGARGMWVRRAGDEAELAAVVAELGVEGGPLLLQPQLVECAGRSLRVIVTGGSVVHVAAAVSSTDWRSNSRFATTGLPATLSGVEESLAVAAATAAGLGHAGLDLMRATAGTVVCELNAFPGPVDDLQRRAAVCDATIAACLALLG